MKKLLERRIRKSSLYKELKRNYRYQNYRDYNQIIMDYLHLRAFVLMMIDRGLKADLQGDLPVRINTELCYLFQENEPQVYCLQPELYSAFINTDLPESCPDIRQSVPFGIILLPENLQDAAGNSTNYIVFAHYSKDNDLPKSDNPDKLKCDRLIIGTAPNAIYGADIRIQEDNTLNLGSIAENPNKKFLDLLESIVLQSILLFQAKTEYILPSQPPCKTGRTKQPKNQQILYPHILGHNFSIKTKSAPAETSQPTGIKRRKHLRRGHLKNVACGKKFSDRKLTWIQPYWTNPE